MKILHKKSKRIAGLFIFAALLTVTGCNKAGEYTTAGYIQLENKKYISALADFEKALAEDNQHAPAQYGKALLLYQNPQSRHTAAWLFQEAYENLNDITKKNSALLYLIEYLLIPPEKDTFQKIPFESIIQKLEKHRQQHGLTPRLLVLYAEVLYRQKNYREGNKMLGQALAVKNEDAALYFHAGLIYATILYNFNDAYKNLQKSLQYGAEYDMVFFLAAQVAYRKNMLAQSRQYISKVYKTDQRKDLIQRAPVFLRDFVIPEPVDLAEIQKKIETRTWYFDL